MSNAGTRGEGLRQRRRGASPDAPKRSLPTISLESFDLYTKVRDEGEGETTEQTSSGATVAILSLIICLILAFFELRAWIIPIQKEHASTMKSHRDVMYSPP